MAEFAQDRSVAQGRYAPRDSAGEAGHDGRAEVQTDKTRALTTLSGQLAVRNAGVAQRAAALAAAPKVQALQALSSRLNARSGSAVQRKRGCNPGTVALAMDAAAGERSTGSVVQCLGDIKFANLVSQGPLAQKGQALVTGLKASATINAYIADKMVLITIVEADQPADVIQVGDQVRINLGRWYFETQALGRVLGLLAHEFAVHPLADATLSQKEKKREDDAVSHKMSFPTGVDGLEINTAAAGQRDHVFAAVPIFERHNIYMKTVLEMAKALIAVAGVQGSGVTGNDPRELVMTYLSDIAMILGTNDNRRVLGDFFDGGARAKTAAAFNAVRTNWLDFVKLDAIANAGVEDITPETKTKIDVGFEALGVIGSYVKSKVTGGGSVDATGFDVGQNQEVSPVQQKVLDEYGLALSPAAVQGADNFWAAINILIGGAKNKDEILIEVANISSGGDADNVKNFFDNVGNDPEPTYVEWVGMSIKRSLRVIMPNGHITEPRGGGAEGVLVIVSGPQRHFRATTTA